jgi:hypothetical protein
MLAEEKAAIRAGCDALDHTPEAARARARFLAANEALMAARPTDPAALAMQLPGSCASSKNRTSVI